MRGTTIADVDGNGQDKAYGRAALAPGDADTEQLLKRLRDVEENVGEILEGARVTPSLLHGDLWIGERLVLAPCGRLSPPAGFIVHVNLVHSRDELPVLLELTAVGNAG